MSHIHLEFLNQLVFFFYAINDPANVDMLNLEDGKSLKHQMEAWI